MHVSSYGRVLQAIRWFIAGSSSYGRRFYDDDDAVVCMCVSPWDVIKLLVESKSCGRTPAQIQLIPQNAHGSHKISFEGCFRNHTLCCKHQVGTYKLFVCSVKTNTNRVVAKIIFVYGIMCFSHVIMIFF